MSAVQKTRFLFSQILVSSGSGPGVRRLCKVLSGMEPLFLGSYFRWWPVLCTCALLLLCMNKLKFRSHYFCVILKPYVGNLDVRSIFLFSKCGGKPLSEVGDWALKFFTVLAKPSQVVFLV